MAELSSLRAVKAAELYPHGLKSLSPSRKGMEHTIQRLGTLQMIPFDQTSPFVKPASVAYEIDGQPRRWDVVSAHDSIGVVLYHRNLQCMLLVRQFRPALYAALLRTASVEQAPIPTFSEGFTCELCAGLVDKAKSLDDIVQEEIEEECGYHVPLSSIKKLTAFPSNVGIQGSTQHLYFAVVEDSMKIEGGGGGVVADGEAIELLALPLANIGAFVLDSAVPKTSAAMFGLVWGKMMVEQGQHERL